MPRQPTGNPRGRPRGSGLGVGDEAPRLTVRLPADLYTRLEAFAEQYRYHRGDPPLAGCVREMVTFCLDHPDVFRQSENIPRTARHHGDISRQSERLPSPVSQAPRTYSRQPGNVPQPVQPHGDDFRQPVNTLVEAAQERSENSRQPINHPTPSEPTRDDFRQPETIPAGFDATRFVLGRLCVNQHEHQDTGQTLYRLPKYVCPPCDAARARERRARRTAAPGQEG